MATSVNDLKDRLRKFLSGDEPDEEFRVWFALALRDAHKANDPDFESLAHAVQGAFSDAASGLYTSDQLEQVLSSLAKHNVAAETAPEYVPPYYRLEGESYYWHDPKVFRYTSSHGAATYVSVSASGSSSPVIAEGEPEAIAAA